MDCHHPISGGFAKTGKIRYVNAGHMWLVNLDSLARYFEQGDPAPAEQSQTAHGIPTNLDDGHTREHTENVCPARRRGVTQLDFHGKS